MVAFNQTRSNIIANGVSTRIRRVYLIDDSGEKTDVTDDFTKADVYLFTGDTTMFRTYLSGAKRGNMGIVAVSVEEETIRDGKSEVSVVFYKTER